MVGGSSVTSGLADAEQHSGEAYRHDWGYAGPIIHDQRTGFEEVK